jgi:hypothetical protein
VRSRGIQHVFGYTCLASVLFGALMLPTKLFATETRVSTLQTISGIQDETEVYRFPAAVTAWNVALIELGTAANDDVYGAAFSTVGGWSLGLAVSRDEWIWSRTQLGGALSLFDRWQSAATGSETNTPALLSHPERPVEFLLARSLGGGRSWGLRLAVASERTYSKSENAGVVTKNKRSASAGQLTLSWRQAGASLLDVGLTVEPIARQERNSDASGVSSSTEIKGKTNLGLEARWIQNAKGAGWYGAGQIQSREFGLKTSSAGTSKSSAFKDRVLAFEGGWAGLQEKANLFAGALISQVTSQGPTITGIGENAVSSHVTSDAKADIKATFVAAALSGEAQVSGGFGAMMGLQYILHGDIVENDDTSGTGAREERSINEISDASLWSLGASWTEGALRVDASVGKELLHNGPYLVSGAATDPLLGRISARWAF